VIVSFCAVAQCSVFTHANILEEHTASNFRVEVTSCVGMHAVEILHGLMTDKSTISHCSNLWASLAAHLTLLDRL
jgi:hypothetical protein